MSAPRPDELADSISDGNPIDWAALERDATPDEQRRLKQFRQVARIAEFNRGLQRPVPDRGAALSVVAGAGSGAPAGPAAAAAVGEWGPLQLLEKLGEGTTGEVWRAWEERLQREVALKLLKPTPRPDAGRSLMDEGAHLARLSHDGVARVYGIETHGGRIGLWMELLEGETLNRIVARQGPFSPAETALIGSRLCQALAAVHAAGLLHRDIKAANIIRTTGGRIVLMDFSLGSRFDVRADSGAPGGPAVAARFSGTPMYMAPEVLQGGPVTVRAEIFSLGILLYYLASGRYPVEAVSLSELAATRSGGGGRRLRDARADLPPRFVEIVERATHLDPERRYGTAGEMEAALRDALNDTPRPGLPPPAPGPRRQIVRAAVAALVVATLAAGGLFLLRGRPVAVQVSNVPYDVEVSFLRLDDDRYVPLLSGDRVAPGNRLALDIKASRPLFVYVLNEDEQGEDWLLYPQAAYDRKNPVPAGDAVRLPGMIEGAETAWKVTSAGGHEYFLVVASPSPLPDLERDLASVPAPEPGRPVATRPASISKRLGEALRGVGGLETVGAAATSGRLADVVRHLGGREAGVQGVWIRKIVFDNPR